ncbi:VOC family protein [Cystobacter fuscus]|uniref:VOC family protein n=1 Tax=Cystobacter fuscus TaxID=43 RepID=UPI002B2DF411|nr:hypothetical protein F0U63_26310 [Cystobacter fuscus]
MIDHTGIGVEDVPSSAAFYDAVLGALGMYRVMELREGDRLDGVGYGIDHPVFWIDRYHPHSVKQHTAFAAKSRAEVEAFYAKALSAGGTDNGVPGLRPTSTGYPLGYYAAFVLDPDGNNIEAVYRESQEQPSQDTLASVFQMVTYRPPSGTADPLLLLTDSALASLKASVARVQYPAELCQQQTPEEWREHVPAIDQQNSGLLGSVADRSGVYVILTAEDPASQWTLKYIGQSKADLSRQRIRSHLVWRNKDTPSGSFTGSKFDEVSRAVMEGKHIGFSFVSIEPASLRHYVEVELIHRFQPAWNSHGRSVDSQEPSADLCEWPRIERIGAGGL